MTTNFVGQKVTMEERLLISYLIFITIKNLIFNFINLIFNIHWKNFASTGLL